MNKIIKYLFFLCCAVCGLSSCDKTETYAEQKDREMSSINSYIQDRKIKVISEDEFLRDTVTDLSQNEYVLFESSGVYMQIVRRGSGEMMKSGEGCDILCRFNEVNLFSPNVLQLSNNYISNNPELNSNIAVDRMAVRKVSGSFTATFKPSAQGVWGMMYRAYGSAQVPAGWLIPLSYIYLGRVDEPAEVNLIVPHDKGQAYATRNVYACAYNITFKRGL